MISQEVENKKELDGGKTDMYCIIILLVINHYED